MCRISSYIYKAIGSIDFEILRVSGETHSRFSFIEAEPLRFLQYASVEVKIIRNFSAKI